MAASVARIGFGSTVGYATSTVAGELISIRGSGKGQAAVEVTHMSSPNRWREYIRGLKEGGTYAVTFNADEDSVTAPLNDTETITITLPLKSGGSTANTVAFPGFFTVWDDDIPLDDKIMITGELKVAGEITYTDGT